MFDWLREGAIWLEQFVVSVPLYVAAPSMIVIGALDSSLLSLPEINDYLVVMRCARDHSAAIYFPLFAAAGSVLGCLLLYPMPFKIFVATAGALEYPRWRFLITVMLARSLRYYIEGILAVYYGERVLRFISDNGLAIFSVVVSLCLVGFAIYALTRRGRKEIPTAVSNKVSREEI